MAHLLTGGASQWDAEKLPPYTVLLEELEGAILSWKQPNKEMVAYRSFKPFLPLLLSYETYQAQLWALWAIQHVLEAHGMCEVSIRVMVRFVGVETFISFCFIGQRYSEMLIAEGIRKILQELTTREDIVNVVSSRAQVILDQLQ